MKKKIIKKTTIKPSKKAKVVDTKPSKKAKVPPKKKPKKKKQTKAVMICILTNQKITLSKEQRVKQLTKLQFDSEEDYQKYYISREGRKLLKEGNTIEEIRKQFNCDNNLEIPLGVLRRYVKKVKDKAAAEQRAKKKAIMETLNEPRKIHEFSYIRKPMDFSNPQDVIALTTNACWCPHLFLDNDRSCEGCQLFKNCACHLRTLKPEKKTSSKKSKHAK